jgi:protein ImuB
VDRLACVNVAALPLQMLLRAHPDWAHVPAAVVEDDRPQALVLYPNRAARRAGVCIGQRYATALGLSRRLQAGTILPSQIAHEVHALTDRLRRHSPRVEPSPEAPGVFWLDVHGLDRLYPSLYVWADEVRADVGSAGPQAVVAVGLTRFGTFALAISHRRTIICASEEEERSRARRVRLARLNFDPKVRDRLLALGIHTVGDFLRLPGDGLRSRFGETAELIHQLAAGTRKTPLVPAQAEERHEQSVEFEEPETSVERLVFVLKRVLDGFVTVFVHRRQAIIEVAIHLKLDNRDSCIERVRPAAPTLDVGQLLTLVRLRLETLHLPAGIVMLRVTVEIGKATADQCRLFPEQTRRDAQAANQALARLRAECGEGSVVRAHLCDAHLPAARFRWEPLEKVPAHSAPRVMPARTLVRRIYVDCQALGSGLSALASAALAGPYFLSGAWWGRGVHREYYFVRTTSGEWWWVYYDARRGQLFLQGQVE